MERANIKRAALIASAAALVLIGSTAAFLTSSDKGDNRFTVGKVGLTLDESSYTDGQKLSAGQIIDKNPTVTNKGNVRELFFVEVTVPCMEATFLDKDGARIPNMTTEPSTDGYRQLGEIYNLLADGGTDGTYKKNAISPPENTNWQISYNSGTSAQPGWHFIDKTQDQEPYDKVPGFRNGKYSTYVFGYNAWVEPGESTVSVFDKLQLRSIVDGDIPGGTLTQVQVNAYSIQADALNVQTDNRDGSPEKYYTADDVSKIYEIIENKKNS